MIAQVMCGSAAGQDGGAVLGGGGVAGPRDEGLGYDMVTNHI